jgi:predicted DNA-binding WGR domain protein
VNRTSNNRRSQKATLEGRDQPPKIAEYIISILIPSEYKEALLGDLAEEFNEATDKFGIYCAYLLYLYQVFRSAPYLLTARIRILFENLLSKPEFQPTASPQIVTEGPVRLRWEKDGRYYEAHVDQDLWGEWVLTRVWGRRGANLGQIRRVPCESFEDAVQALAVVRSQRIRRGYRGVETRG